eukprot:284819901_6
MRLSQSLTVDAASQVLLRFASGLSCLSAKQPEQGPVAVDSVQHKHEKFKDSCYRVANCKNHHNVMRHSAHLYRNYDASFSALISLSWSATGIAVTPLSDDIQIGHHCAGRKIYSPSEPPPWATVFSYAFLQRTGCMMRKPQRLQESAAPIAGWSQESSEPVTGNQESAESISGWSQEFAECITGIGV